MGNVLEAQPTIARLESGSKYIKTHSAIINVGRLITASERSSLIISSACRYISGSPSNHQVEKQKDVHVGQYDNAFPNSMYLNLYYCKKEHI